MPTEEEIQQVLAEDQEALRRIGQQMLDEDNRQRSLQEVATKYFGTLKTSGKSAARKAVRKALRSRSKSST